MKESGVGVGLLKIEESESELLCTDSTALRSIQIKSKLIQNSYIYGFMIELCRQQTKVIKTVRMEVFRGIGQRGLPAH
jgi:hypothetical protein